MSGVVKLGDHVEVVGGKVRIGEIGEVKLISDNIYLVKFSNGSEFMNAEDIAYCEYSIYDEAAESYETVQPYTDKLDGGGQRFNKDKLPMELVPPSALEAMARVLRYGANKYAERNWERGMDWSVPYACLLRHLTSWFQGEDKDTESGLSHLDHVLMNAAMLTHFERYYPQGDDRPSYYQLAPQFDSVEEEEQYWYDQREAERDQRNEQLEMFTHPPRTEKMQT